MKEFKMKVIRGRSQITFTDFWPFLTPSPWLTSLIKQNLPNRLSDVVISSLKPWFVNDPLDMT